MNQPEASAVWLLFQLGLTGRDLQPGSPDESSGSLGTSLFPSHQLGLKRTLRCGGSSVLIVAPVRY